MEMICFHFLVDSKGNCTPKQPDMSYKFFPRTITIINNYVSSYQIQSFYSYQKPELHREGFLSCLYNNIRHLLIFAFICMCQYRTLLTHTESCFWRTRVHFRLSTYLAKKGLFKLCCWPTVHLL